MRTIKVKRVWQITALFVKTEIRVDGDKKAVLKNGKTFTFSLDLNRHTLQAAAPYSKAGATAIYSNSETLFSGKENESFLLKKEKGGWKLFRN